MKGKNRAALKHNSGQPAVFIIQVQPFSFYTNVINHSTVAGS